MNDQTDTPSTEELANELAATEGSEATLETAPDPAPADTAEPEAPAAQADPTPDPELPAAATSEKTIAPNGSNSQAEKKASDTTRRRKAIADAPELKPLPGEEEEEKRKASIRAAIAEVQEALDEALALAEECRGNLRELMADLYPHMTGSDKLVDAVRGHVAAQKKIRANRASNPARIAEILKAAGRSPIDQAFHVQRARGARRPTRSPPKPAAGDGAAAPTE